MRTISKLLLVLLVAGLGMLYSCNSRTNDNTADQTNDSATAQGDNTTTDATMDNADGAMGMDAEALTLVMTVDMNEINAANEAQKKKLSQPVMEYAKMLHTEHTKNLEKGRNLGQSMNQAPVETEMVANLKAKGTSMLTALAPLTGAQFERAYIDGMIKDHQEALSMLDNQLIPGAKSEEVKKHLNETRGHVAMHLNHAEQLKQNM